MTLSMQLICPHCNEEFELDWTKADHRESEISCPHCRLPVSFLGISEPTIDALALDEPEANFAAYEDELPDQSFDQMTGFEIKDTDLPPNSLYSAPEPEGSSLIWALGIVLLGILLGLQLVWFIRADLRQLPALQPWILPLCEKIDCHLPPLSDISKIEILSSDIRNHPSEAGAFEINLVIQSHSEFLQPFPAIELDLTGARGQLVATRKFKPSEYIADKSLTRMPTTQPVHIYLVIRETKQTVAGYSFRFHENEF